MPIHLRYLRRGDVGVVAGRESPALDGSMDLKIGDLIIFHGGHGAASYSMPGVIYEEPDYDHVGGGRCDHEPKCQWFFVKLESGSIHYGYVDQMVRRDPDSIDS